MILRPTLDDVKIIGYHLGKIVMGIGACMAVPLVLALALREFDPALDYCAGLAAAMLSGMALRAACRTDEDLNWMQGMIVVALSWIAAMVIAAVPLWLSGHWISFLDTCFDTMSGFATTGLLS